MIYIIDFSTEQFTKRHIEPLFHFSAAEAGRVVGIVVRVDGISMVVQNHSIVAHFHTKEKGRPPQKQQPTSNHFSQKKKKGRRGDMRRQRKEMKGRGGTEEEKNSRILVVLGQSFCRRDQLCKELGVDLSTVPGRPTRT